MKGAKMFKVKMIVSGRVQGVGFRYFVIISARELGILGRVWNNDDGTVGILAQTDDSQKSSCFMTINFLYCWIILFVVSKCLANILY